MSTSDTMTQAVIRLSEGIGELNGTVKGMQVALKDNADQTRANTDALQSVKVTFAAMDQRVRYVEAKVNDNSFVMSDETLGFMWASWRWLKRHWAPAAIVSCASGIATWVGVHLQSRI